MIESLQSENADLKKNLSLAGSRQKELKVCVCVCVCVYMCVCVCVCVLVDGFRCRANL